MNEDEEKRVLEAFKELVGQAELPFADEYISAYGNVNRNGRSYSSESLATMLEQIQKISPVTIDPNDMKSLGLTPEPPHKEPAVREFQDLADFVTAIRNGIGPMIKGVQVTFNNPPEEASLIIVLKYSSNDRFATVLDDLDRFFDYHRVAGYDSIEYSIRIEKEVIKYGPDSIQRTTRPSATRSRGKESKPGPLELLRHTEKLGIGVLNPRAIAKGTLQVPTD